MTYVPTLTIQQALRFELTHRPQLQKQAWTLKDALRWEAERAKEQRCA